MTRPRDEGPARCDALRPAVADVAGILQVVTQARARADHLNAENARAREVAVLVFDLDIALGHAHALTDDVDIDGVLALTVALDRILDLDLRCEPQRELVHDIQVARTLCDDLATTLAGAAQVVTAPERTEVRPGLLPLGMMRAAVRVLPARHRSRYDQEFRAERAELVEQPGCAQLSYALRQLLRSWHLRIVLADALAAPKQDRGAAP
ncbi:MAG TPA: hypothetical protein VGJ13_11570 [Pseudonocardiaceae bacterium]